MSKGDFYFPLYHHVFTTATVGWTNEEVGVYIRLLIRQFDKGFVPSKLSELEKVCPGVSKVWKTVGKKFKSSGKNMLQNEIMEGVRSKIAGKREAYRANGAKGGLAKSRLKSGNGLAIGKQSLSNGATMIIDNSNSKKKEEEEESKTQLFFEAFRRSTGNNISDEELKTEVGKFQNKYPQADPKNSGALINAWASNIKPQANKKDKNSFV